MSDPNSPANIEDLSVCERSASQLAAQFGVDVQDVLIWAKKSYTPEQKKAYEVKLDGSDSVIAFHAVLDDYVAAQATAKEKTVTDAPLSRGQFPRSAQKVSSWKI